MALTIKDGAGSTTSLKTTLTGSDHMPHHIVQAVSGTVNVSASAASPVYVTGNVSVNQPINVDVDISDKLTVVVSSSATSNTVWVTSSATYPLNATIVNTFFNDAVAGLSQSYWNSDGGGENALAIKFRNINTNVLSPSQEAIYVSTTASAVTIDNTGFQQAINYLTAATDLGNSDYRLKVNVLNTGSVNISNIGADVAFTALSYSFADNSLKVKLTGSNTIKEGTYDILLVRGTGSETTISNTGFQQLVNYLTAATDLGDSDYRLKVNVLNTASVNVSNIGADVAFTALSYSFADNSLKVKLTGSNTIQEGGYDILRVRTTGSSVSIDNTGFQQAINYITSAYNSGDSVGKFNVHLTGNSNVTIDNAGFQSVVNQLTASAWNNGSTYAVQVKVTGAAEVSNTLQTALHVTSSEGLLVKEKQVKTSTATGIYYPGQYDWSANSGTFVLAAEDNDRKGLIISNPSSERLYVVVGSGSNNGFTLASTGSAPTIFSFIVYPSGTYTAEPVMAGAFHAGFFVSQSNFTEVPYAMSTKVIY